MPRRAAIIPQMQIHYRIYIEAFHSNDRMKYEHLLVLEFRDELIQVVF